MYVSDPLARLIAPSTADTLCVAFVLKFTIVCAAWFQLFCCCFCHIILLIASSDL